MHVRVDLKSIDLSSCVLGDLGFPSLEAEIRRMAAEFIQGVLENNLKLEVQPLDEDGPMYVVLWADLNDDWESPIAEIKVDDLFKEYLKKKKSRS